ncbi:uncharacterized protein L201_005899 [Kwoniella dendrophila CBS 6074]|uniref:F-box domain-containing protein n=1 Tax=Kwoniella dendrophila CBS 6074 TaxID=1295534 RepID=A0AAX4JZS4_9TREE
MSRSRRSNRVLSSPTSDIDQPPDEVPISAATVWSLPNLRSSILSYLPSYALVNILILSKDNLEAGIEVLYHKLTWKQCRKLESSCTSISRSRRYTSAIRHISKVGTGPKLPPPAELYARYPGLKWITRDEEHLELVSSPTSYEENKFINRTNIKGVFIEDVSSRIKGDFPSDWDVEWDVNHLRITTSSSYEPEKDLKSDLKRMYSTWCEKKGIFAINVKEVEIDVVTPIEDLSETIVKLHENGEKLPKRLHVSIKETEDSINIINFLDNMAPLLEGITCLAPTKGSSGIITNIHDFFSAEHKWLRSKDTKLKQLGVTLKVPPLSTDSNPSPLVVYSEYEGPPVGLDYFGLTLDLSGIRPSPGNRTDIFANLPALSEIAKAMFSFGGSNCKYGIGVIETNEDTLRSRILTSLLGAELVHLMTDEEETIGWKQLSAEERV